MQISRTFFAIVAALVLGGALGLAVRGINTQTTLATDQAACMNQVQDAKMILGSLMTGNPTMTAPIPATKSTSVALGSPSKSTPNTRTLTVQANGSVVSFNEQVTSGTCASSIPIHTLELPSNTFYARPTPTP